MGIPWFIRINDADTIITYELIEIFYFVDQRHIQLDFLFVKCQFNLL